MIDILAANVQSVKERICAAARRAGRDPASVTLVAVTKTQPVEVIRTAYELGLRDFGENRLEEASGKFDLLPPDIRWHMVGHVQSRKAPQAIGPYSLVHSVDGIKLARRLNRFAGEEGIELPILIEVNLSGEESKYGLSADDLEIAVIAMCDFEWLRIQGLMTMAPIVPEPEEARPIFAALRGLRNHLAPRFPDCQWNHLSMGMTDDFEVAVEEGATIVRIGRAIFGERR